MTVKIKQNLNIGFKLLTILVLMFLFILVVMKPSLKNISNVQNTIYISYFFVDSIQILIFGVINVIIYLAAFNPRGTRNSQAASLLIFFAVHLILLIFTFIMFGTRDYLSSDQVAPQSSADLLLISTFKFLLITLLITYFFHFYFLVLSWLKSYKALANKTIN